MKGFFITFLILSSALFSKSNVTFNGDVLTLLDNRIEVGELAPNFELIKNDLSTVELSDFKGKNLVISSIVSIDTPVCEIQTKKFNLKASELQDTVVLTVSTDLPFALERYCADEGIENTLTLSDYKTRNFSKDYGLYIEELALSSRAVIVIDKNGKVAYVNYSDEITEEPDYESAFNVLKTLK